MEHVQDSVLQEHRVVIKETPLIIRHLVAGDYLQVHGLTVEDDWALCAVEIQTGIEIYPTGAVGAFTEDGTIICACMSAPAASPVAFIGLFITDEKYRGRGIGSYVFSIVMKLLGDRNVVLDSLLNATRFYTTRGFHKTGMLQYSVKGTPTPIPQNQFSGDLRVENLTADNMDEMLAYESSICVVDRSEFIKAWAGKGSTFIARRENAVCGMCVVWKYKTDPDKYRLAAFYADDREVAKAVLSKVVNEVVGCGSILMYFPHDSLDNASYLLDTFNLKFDKAVDNCRMVTKTDMMGIPLYKVYSVTYTVSDFI